MADLQGYQSLQRRFAAVSAVPQTLMEKLAAQTVREAKILVPKKTANLERTIHVASVTADNATVVASAKYAPYVEFDTRPHIITPNAKKALRWAATGAGRRLTGSPRLAAIAGGLGGVVFATVVHHPGTKAQPFLMPGARNAIGKADLAGQVTAAWNKAG